MKTTTYPFRVTGNIRLHVDRETAPTDADMLPFLPPVAPMAMPRQEMGARQGWRRAMDLFRLSLAERQVD